MIQSLKTIKNRIRGIQNAHKVTSAMEMISVTKLSRTQKMLYAARPYFQKMQELFDRLTLAGESNLTNPFFKERPEKKRIVLCVLTSDNGLCSNYNTNIIRFAEEFMRQRKPEEVKLITVGKKGFKYFTSHSASMLHSYIGLNGKYSDKIKDEISNNLISLFLENKADEVYIAYTHFKTALVLKPVIVKFLSLKVNKAEAIDYLFEPEKEKILEDFIPVYLSTKLRLILLEAFTSEHASRTIAMKMATENAMELLHKLVLLRNKVRQANITRDILEIISSAEALKG